MVCSCWRSVTSIQPEDPGQPIVGLTAQQLDKLPKQYMFGTDSPPPPQTHLDSEAHRFVKLEMACQTVVKLLQCQIGLMFLRSSMFRIHFLKMRKKMII